MQDGFRPERSNKGEEGAILGDHLEVSSRAKWWILSFFLVFALLIYATKAILLPFVAGFAVAYLLDPLADRLEAWKFPRWFATTTILVLFFIGGAGVFLALYPLLQSQFLGLINNFPGYIESLRPVIDNILTALSERFGLEVAANSESLISAAGERALAQAGDVLTAFFRQSMALFNLLSLLLITPVVAFFLLRDWDLLIAKIDDWLPKDEAPAIRTIAYDIDRALAGFVRGQTLVSLTMAVLYGIGWTLVGLEYALIMGLVAGIMAYVPFVGALVASLIALLLGLGQFGLDIWQLLQIFLVFVVVQIIEGAFLTPRFIGSRVGLHPVWVLFAIFAGGEIMGFTGILLALPVAAAIGVFVRWLIDRYLESDVHRGKAKKKQPGKETKES